ncbi:MAG: TadE/TadG family type IV pilus assembly protein [Anderseniella sp.]|jgi:Flp pilus assembly protein TadG|nr:TadE/TadG family type IV pilus assembly protein [Anderseniella sp.]
MSVRTLSRGALARCLKRFLRNSSGNLGAVVALSVAPLMMAGGAAVDYGNWVSVQARLQAAVDAAALAAGREANLSDEDLQTVAVNYFNANFGTPRNIGQPEMTLTVKDNAIRVDAHVEVDNYLMKAIGINSQVVATFAEVSKEATNLDVVLVFDNTGSMAQEQRLSTLKVAANDFVEILFGPRQTASTLKVGVVPFSQFVNVGPDKAGASWVDTGGEHKFSQANFKQTGWHNWMAWQNVTKLSRKHTWAGCVEAREGALAVSDTEPNPAVPETLFPPAFAPDEPGKVAENQSCYGADGTKQDCGWTTKYRYFNSYMTDTGADGDLDDMQRDTRKYRRNRADPASRGPNQGCNIQPIRALTNEKAPVLATIKGMKADGYTHVAEGVGWGLRVLSPGEPFTEGRPYSSETTKAMVLLTDGENTFENQPNHNLSTYTAYGYLAQERLGTTNYWTGVKKQNALLSEACANVKAEDIVVYSFAYNVPSATQRQLIKDCASDPEKYFDPPTNEALVQNFQQIADELRRLHLSK